VQRGHESKGRCVWGGGHLEAVEAVGNVVIAIRIEQTMNFFAEIVAALLDAFVPPLFWGAALYRCTHLQYRTTHLLSSFCSDVNLDIKVDIFDLLPYTCGNQSGNRYLL